MKPEVLPDNVKLDVGIYTGTMSGYVIKVKDFTWESNEIGVRGINCPVAIEVFESNGKKYFQF